MKKKFYYGELAGLPSSSYTVTVNTINCTASSYPTEVSVGATFSITFTANSTIYSESDFDVIMSGDNLVKRYDSTTKKLTITCTDVNSHISIKVTAAIYYNITIRYKLPNGSVVYSTTTPTKTRNYSNNIEVPAFNTTSIYYGISTYSIISLDEVDDNSRLLGLLQSPTNDPVYDTLVISINFYKDVIIDVYLTEKYVRMTYSYYTPECTITGNTALAKYNTPYAIAVVPESGYMFSKARVLMDDTTEVINTRSNPAPLTLTFSMGLYTSAVMYIECELFITDLNYHDYLFDVNCPRNAGVDKDFGFDPNSPDTYTQRPSMYFLGQSLVETNNGRYNLLYRYNTNNVVAGTSDWFIPVTYGKLIVDRERPHNFEYYSTPNELNENSKILTWELYNPIIYSYAYAHPVKFAVKHPIEHFLIPTFADNNDTGKWIGYWATTRFTHKSTNAITDYFNEDSFDSAYAYVNTYSYINNGYVELALKPYFVYAPGYIRPVDNFKSQNYMSANNNYLQLTNFGIVTNTLDADDWGNYTTYSNLYELYPSNLGFLINDPDANIGNYSYDQARNIAGAYLYNGDVLLIDMYTGAILTSDRIMQAGDIILQSQTASGLGKLNNNKAMHLHIETIASYEVTYHNNIFVTYLKEPDQTQSLFDCGIPAFGVNEAAMGLVYSDDFGLLTADIDDDPLTGPIDPLTLDSYCNRVEFPSYTTMRLERDSISDIKYFTWYYLNSLASGSPETLGGWYIKKNAYISNSHSNGFAYTVITSGYDFAPNGYGYLLVPDHIMYLLSYCSDYPGLINWPQEYSDLSGNSPSFTDTAMYTIKYFIIDHDPNDNICTARPYLIFPLALFSTDEYLYDNSNFCEYFKILSDNYYEMFDASGAKYDKTLVEGTSQTDIRLPYYHILPIDLIYALLIEFESAYGYIADDMVFTEDPAILDILKRIFKERFNMSLVSYYDIINENIKGEPYGHLYQLYVGIPITGEKAK